MPDSEDLSSDDDSMSSTDYDEKHDELDGHRPANREISRTLSRTPTRRPAAATGAALTQTVSRRQTALSKIRSRPVPSFQHPLAHEATKEDVLVDFDGEEDPYRPMNWPLKKKATTTLLYGLVTMSASWASSSYSAGTSQVKKQFHVGSEVATLGTTLFLFGFG